MVCIQEWPSKGFEGLVPSLSLLTCKIHILKPWIIISRCFPKADFILGHPVFIDDFIHDQFVILQRVRYLISFPQSFIENILVRLTHQFSYFKNLCYFVLFFYKQQIVENIQNFIFFMFRPKLCFVSAACCTKLNKKCYENNKHWTNQNTYNVSFKREFLVFDGWRSMVFK